MNVKKIIVLALSMCMVILLAGCSLWGSQVDMAESISENLDINDFKWTTIESKVDGKDVCALSFTNNSEYNLLAVILFFKAKKPIVVEQSDGKTISAGTLRGREGVYISSKGTVDDIFLTLAASTDKYASDDNFVYVTKEQYDSTEPDELVVAIAGSDNRFYRASYDFATKKWTIQTFDNEINTWPKKDVAKLVPQIEGDAITKTDGMEDTCYITVYGISQEKYKDYIEQVKAKGFNVGINEYEEEDVDANKALVFEASNQNKDTVKITYVAKTQVLDIDIDKGDKQ